MSQPSPYPSPPYSQSEQMDPHALKSVLASTWQVLEQPPPPTLREILSAYKSKGDGDRDMLLAMLNAKSAEDQRIAAIATLHQKMLDARASPLSPSRDHTSSFGQPSGPSTYQHNASSSFAHSPTLPRISPTASPRDVTLPSIHAPTSPRKRARTSRSPPPMRRRHSGQSHQHQAVAASEQLPPSPPFSSPGRSTLNSELTSHPPRDAMAIGSLLSSSSHQQHDADSEWPSRTSAERTGSAAVERETYRRQAQVSG